MKRINLSFESKEEAAASLRAIADEVEAGQAKVMGVGRDPNNPALLVFTLLGAKDDG